MGRVQRKLRICGALRVVSVGGVDLQVDTTREQSAQGCQVCGNAAARKREAQRTYFPKSSTPADERVVRLVNERLQAKRLIPVELDRNDFADGLPVKEHNAAFVNGIE